MCIFHYFSLLYFYFSSSINDVYFAFPKPYMDLFNFYEWIIKSFLSSLESFTEQIKYLKLFFWYNLFFDARIFSINIIHLGNIFIQFFVFTIRKISIKVSSITSFLFLLFLRKAFITIFTLLYFLFYVSFNIFFFFSLFDIFSCFCFTIFIKGSKTLYHTLMNSFLLLYIFIHYSVSWCKKKIKNTWRYDLFS